MFCPVPQEAIFILCQSKSLSQLCKGDDGFVDRCLTLADAGSGFGKGTVDDVGNGVYSMAFQKGAMIAFNDMDRHFPITHLWTKREDFRSIYPERNYETS